MGNSMGKKILDLCGGTGKNPRSFKKGMETVQSCLDIIHTCRYKPIRNKDNKLKFWALENPYSGYLKWFLGEPYYTFQPYDFGDPYTKRTALWGVFNKPKENPVDPERNGNGEGTFVKEVEHFKHLKQHQIPEGYKDKTGYTWRTIVRSITPEGFAQSFYRANK